MNKKLKNNTLEPSHEPLWMRQARDYLDRIQRLGAVRGSIAASEATKEFIAAHGVSGNSLQRAVSALEFIQERYPGLLGEGKGSELQLAKVELLKRLDAANSEMGNHLIDPILTNKISLRELRRIHAQNLDATPTGLRDRRSNTKFLGMRFDEAVFTLLAQNPNLVGATTIARPTTSIARIRYLQVDAVGSLEDGRQLGVMSRYLPKEDRGRMLLDAKLPLAVFFAANFFDAFLLVLPHHSDSELVTDLCSWLHEQCGGKARVAIFNEESSPSEHGLSIR